VEVRYKLKKLAWITGAGGLIGNYLLKTVPESWAVRGLNRGDLDLFDLDAVAAELMVDLPSVIIHCAAISKNPVCDANPELARRVNTELVASLCKLAAEIPFADGIPIVFLSTDLVFDGQKGNYVESDSPNPLGIYAETKARAEEFVLKYPQGTVIRTSLNAGHSPTGNRAFNEEIRAAFKEGRTLNLFEDEFRCPIPAEITARAIWEIIGEPGLFHLCGSERLSRAEIGELLAGNHPELNPKIVRGTIRDYKGSPRPADTSMNSAKIQARLSFELPKFSEWVKSQPLESL
jgi:dTDP-4-dehydrorhamnose reductase